MNVGARRAPAVIFGKAGVVTTGEVELPPLEAEEVLIETRVSVVSAGTEGWVLHDRMGWAGRSPYPLVPGYQRAGVVRAVGAAVRGLSVGDRVATTTCRLAGAVRAHWGGHVALGQEVQAEVLLIPARVSDLDAANVAVAQVGYNAASRPRLEGGEVAAVFGDGLIGQMAAQALRARGARVVLCGRRALRLELGARHSADAVVDLTAGAPREALRALAPSGLDVVVDTSTVPDMALFLDVLRPRDGQIVLSGSYYTNYARGEGLMVDADALQRREIALLTNSGWTRQRLAATLALMAAGKLRTPPLITHLQTYQDAPRA
jgi:2-desacetyl-2-hydroxyethyl bacteriochlorophyllide A dehydrogenase